MWLDRANFLSYSLRRNLQSLRKSFEGKSNMSTKTKMVERPLTLQDFIDEGLINPEHKLSAKAKTRLLSLTRAEMITAKFIGAKLGYEIVEELIENHGNKGGIALGIF